MTIDAVESSVKHCYSTWSKDYYKDYYLNASAYPPVHRDIIRDVLSEKNCENVLDAGCGPASMLRDLVGVVPELYGFDLTPEMVDEAKVVLSEQGVPAERVWEGSVLDRDSFVCPTDGQTTAFDATICIGVLPHIPEAQDRLALENLRDSVRPGGLVLAEARNQLFSLFTLNRYSYQLFAESLIGLKQLSHGCSDREAHLQVVDDELQARFRMELPPVRGGKEDEPGYDEVLSRTHNPFELQQLATEVGLENVKLDFYHYHVLPPMFESQDPEWFREQSLALERSGDWRGYFMASAFLLSGTRPQ